MEKYDRRVSIQPKKNSRLLVYFMYMLTTFCTHDWFVSAYVHKIVQINFGHTEDVQLMNNVQYFGLIAESMHYSFQKLNEFTIIA